MDENQPEKYTALRKYLAFPKKAVFFRAYKPFFFRIRLLRESFVISQIHGQASLKSVVIASPQAWRSRLGFSMSGRDCFSASWRIVNFFLKGVRKMAVQERSKGNFIARVRYALQEAFSPLPEVPMSPEEAAEQTERRKKAQEAGEHYYESKPVKIIPPGGRRRS